MDKRKERRFKQWNKTSIKSASGPREFNDPAGINAYTYFEWDATWGNLEHIVPRVEVQ